MLRQNKRKNNYINNEFNILSYTAVIVVIIIIIIIITYRSWNGNLS